MKLSRRKDHVENSLASDFGCPSGISCALSLAGMERFAARSMGLDILSAEHSGGILGTARQKVWQIRQIAVLTSIIIQYKVIENL